MLSGVKFIPRERISDVRPNKFSLLMLNYGVLLVHVTL